MTAMNAVDISNSQPFLLDSSIIAHMGGLLDSPYMPKPTEKTSIYDALMALRPDGLKPGKWATQAGLARNYFIDLKKHDNPSEETLAKLLDVIDVSPVAFAASRETVASEVMLPTGIREAPLGFGHQPLRPLPLMGTATGGEYGDLDEDIELTELFMGQVEYLVRPQSLADDRDAYALQIVGVSMAPRYHPGERVGVSPRAAIGVGDYVIVQLRGPDSSGEGERIKYVLIKELVKRTGSFVELRQFNPEMTFRIETKRVAAMHRVQGTLF